MLGKRRRLSDARGNHDKRPHFDQPFDSSQRQRLKRWIQKSNELQHRTQTEQRCTTSNNSKRLVDWSSQNLVAFSDYATAKANNKLAADCSSSTCGPCVSIFAYEKQLKQPATQVNGNGDAPDLTNSKQSRYKRRLFPPEIPLRPGLSGVQSVPEPSSISSGILATEYLSRPSLISFSPSGTSLIAYFPSRHTHPDPSLPRIAQLGRLCIWKQGHSRALNDWTLCQQVVCNLFSMLGATPLVESIGNQAGANLAIDQLSLSSLLQTRREVDHIIDEPVEITWIGIGRQLNLAGKRHQRRSPARGPQFMAQVGESESLQDLSEEQAFVIIGSQGRVYHFHRRSGTAAYGPSLFPLANVLPKGDLFSITEADLFSESLAPALTDPTSALHPPAPQNKQRSFTTSAQTSSRSVVSASIGRVVDSNSLLVATCSRRTRASAPNAYSSFSLHETASPAFPGPVGIDGSMAVGVDLLATPVNGTPGAFGHSPRTNGVAAQGARVGPSASPAAGFPLARSSPSHNLFSGTSPRPSSPAPSMVLPISTHSVMERSQDSEDFDVWRDVIVVSEVVCSYSSAGDVRMRTRTTGTLSTSLTADDAGDESAEAACPVIDLQFCETAPSITASGRESRPSSSAGLTLCAAMGTQKDAAAIIRRWKVGSQRLASPELSQSFQQFNESAWNKAAAEKSRNWCYDLLQDCRMSEASAVFFLPSHQAGLSAPNLILLQSSLESAVTSRLATWDPDSTSEIKMTQSCAIPTHTSCPVLSPDCLQIAQISFSSPLHNKLLVQSIKPIVPDTSDLDVEMTKLLTAAGIARRHLQDTATAHADEAVNRLFLRALAAVKLFHTGRRIRASGHSEIYYPMEHVWPLLPIAEWVTNETRAVCAAAVLESESLPATDPTSALRPLSRLLLHRTGCHVWARLTLEVVKLFQWLSDDKEDHDPPQHWHVRDLGSQNPARVYSVDTGQRAIAKQIVELRQSRSGLHLSAVAASIKSLADQLAPSDMARPLTSQEHTNRLRMLSSALSAPSGVADSVVLLLTEGEMDWEGEALVDAEPVRDAISEVKLKPNQARIECIRCGERSSPDPGAAVRHRCLCGGPWWLLL